MASHMRPQMPDQQPPQDRTENRLSRQFDEIERRVPLWLARFINWLRRPGVQLVRIPLGLLLVVGGIFSFLPILGIWMLPLGLLILALDVRLLRGPVTNGIVRVRKWWRQRQQRKAAAARNHRQD